MAFTGPFCKDCRHFKVNAAGVEYGDTPYGRALRRDNSTCLAPIPDVVMDGAPRIHYEHNAQDMRWAGPCGLRGYLFEPKPKEG